MAKSAREKIRLVSSAGTGHFYTTDKNKRNMPEKMEIKKYDPTIRQARDLQRSQNQVSLALACCWKESRLSGGIFFAQKSAEQQSATDQKAH